MQTDSPPLMSFLEPGLPGLLRALRIGSGGAGPAGWPGLGGWSCKDAPKWPSLLASSSFRGFLPGRASTSLARF